MVPKRMKFQLKFLNSTIIPPILYSFDIFQWSEMMELGKKNDELKVQLKDRIKAQSPNKCCTLIYTVS